MANPAGLPKSSRLTAANTSGVRGVHYCNRYGKWRASIGVNGAQYFLGYFANKQDAIDARERAELVHGYRDNHAD